MRARIFLTGRVRASTKKFTSQKQTLHLIQINYTHLKLPEEIIYEKSLMFHRENAKKNSRRGLKVNVVDE